MENWIDIEKFDIKQYAENLVKSGREAVKWEIKKLEWIREEEAKEAKAKREAA